jgi:5-methyltetrahydrofolate--homocysteine methyltransferase
VADILASLRSGRVLLMDGAMGTELQRAGLQPGACAELWDVTHAGRVRAVHDRYVQAGAEVLLTNTFQANPPQLARFGLADRLEEINRRALWLARRAAGRQRFILADIGPIVEPHTAVEFADFKVLGRLLSSLEGADGVLLETCSSPRALAAMRYAFHRIPEAEDIPLLLSLSYRRDPNGALVSLSGHTPETFARHAEAHGVAALGVNCGRDIGLDEVIEIVRRYRQATELPLFARPNAGTPVQEGSNWHYPLSAETFAARLPELLEAGVCMIGGCCGTTPDHIAACRPVIDSWNRKHGS